MQCTQPLQPHEGHRVICIKNNLGDVGNLLQVRVIIYNSLHIYTTKHKVDRSKLSKAFFVGSHDLTPILFLAPYIYYSFLNQILCLEGGENKPTKKKTNTTFSLLCVTKQLGRENLQCYFNQSLYYTIIFLIIKKIMCHKTLFYFIYQIRK